MIARPHVCLRCQLRLARRSTPSRTQIARQSTNAKLRDSVEIQDDIRPPVRRVKAGGAFSSFVSVTDGSLEKKPAVPTDRDSGFTEIETHTPSGRFYGHRGQLQRENRELLKLKSLGDPAEVIILRDTEFKAYSFGAKQIEDLAPRSINILAELDNERGLVGRKEVEENINQFRPQKGKEPQTEEDFNNIVQEIQASFTSSQLARYIQAHEKGVPKLAGDALITGITPWTPGISKSKDPLDEEDRGYSFSSYTGKQRLALRLVRHCWNLGLPQLEEGIGEIEVELRPRDYYLLLQGAKSSIRNIGSQYMARIEGYRERHTLRITTTKAISESIVQEIERVVGSIRRVQINLGVLLPPGPGPRWQRLKNWSSTNYDAAMLNELGNLTKTDIKLIPQKKLLVSYIDEDPESPLANRVDIVRRLLLTSGNFSGRKNHLLVSKEMEDQNQGAFIKYPLDDGFPWHERLRNWVRWTAPTKKGVNSGESQVQNQAIEEPAAEEQDDFQETESQAVESPQPKRKGPWSTKLHTESSAFFGSILHRLPDDSKSIDKLLPADLSTKARQIFCTVVPNLSHMLSTQPVQRSKVVESFIFHFQPNPFFVPAKSRHPIGSEALSAFPPLEMRLSVDPESQELTMKELQAIVAVDSSDVMLPDSNVDVRFQQKVKCRFQPPRSNFPKGVKEFLQTAELNVSFEKGKIRTPAKLTIPIASHLCRGRGLDLLGKGKGEVQDVEYLYTGLEIRKRLAIEFNGWRMIYTSFESGSAGGRRSELKLRPIRLTEAGERDTNNSDTKEEDFVKMALQLADDLNLGKVTAYVDTEGPPLVRRLTTPKGKRVFWGKRYFKRRVAIRYERREGDEEMTEETQESTAEGEEREEDDD